MPDGLTTIGFANALRSKTITLTDALPDITTDLEIRGLGRSDLAVDANAPGESRRIFTISGGAEVAIRGLTLRNGNLDTPLGGGAIAVTGAGTKATLVDLALTDNKALGGKGGGLLVADGAHANLDSLRVAGNTAQAGGGIAVIGGATVEIEETEIANNGVDLDGGGLLVENSQASLYAVTLLENESESFGGGAMFGDSAKATLDRVTIQFNVARSEGGGIRVSGRGTEVEVLRSTIDSNSADRGGGVNSDEVGKLTVRTSLIAHNEANVGAGGMVRDVSRARFENTTISGNVARQQGGGLAVFGINAMAELLNTTIARNTASDGGGIYLGFGSVAIWLANTLVAENTGQIGFTNCSFVNGSITSEGHNLSDDNSCSLFMTAATDKLNANAGLLDLDDYGGPTMTHALQSGSEAIDAGDPSLCPATDQRGYGRNGTCDIGAFEFEGVPPVELGLDMVGPSRRSEKAGITES